MFCVNEVTLGRKIECSFVVCGCSFLYQRLISRTSLEVLMLQWVVCDWRRPIKYSPTSLHRCDVIVKQRRRVAQNITKFRLKVSAFPHTINAQFLAKRIRRKKLISAKVWWRSAACLKLFPEKKPPKISSPPIFLLTVLLLKSPKATKQHIKQ